MAATQTDRLDNVNTFYPIDLVSITTLMPPFIPTGQAFYALVITGGSPVPLPYHPWCAREDMTVEEFPRQNMVVVEAARQSMTVTEAPRKNMPDPGC